MSGVTAPTSDMVPVPVVWVVSMLAVDLYRWYMVCFVLSRTGISMLARMHTLNDVTTLVYNVLPNARLVLRLNVRVCGTFTLENVNVNVVVTMISFSV